MLLGTRFAIHKGGGYYVRLGNRWESYILLDTYVYIRVARVGRRFYLASCTWVIFRSSKKRKTNKSFTRRVTCKAKPDKWHKWCRKPIRYYNNKSITNSRNTTKKKFVGFLADRKWKSSPSRESSRNLKCFVIVLSFFLGTARQVLWATTRGFVQHLKKKMGQVFQIMSVGQSAWVCVNCFRTDLEKNELKLEQVSVCEIPNGKR